MTILGLGPGPAALLTQQAAAVLQNAPEVYLRTSIHPTVAGLPEHLQVRSFDRLYQQLPTFEAVYTAIVDEVWRLAQRPEGVVYAVPGHPLVAEATVQALLARAKAEGREATVVPGLSFIEPALTALGIDPFGAESSGLQLVDALSPSIDPGRPALVGQLYSRDVASQLKLELLELYPAEHPVSVVIAAGCPDQRVLALPLYQLDREPALDHLTCLYVPALTLAENMASFGGLLDIVAKLRAPDGCPWDREQTHQSLKPYLIEEAYEALEALEQDDPDSLQEELGDLLLNILLHCQIASENGDFSARDAIRGIAEKLIRRHPHVFGEVQVASAAEVVQNWEAIKSKERAERTSVLKSLPKSLPALAYTRSLQERLSQLDLPMEEGLAASALATDLGRRLFSLAVQAAGAGDNPEEVLRHANTSFRQAFERLEALAWERGATVQDLPLAERAALWQQVWRESAG